MARVEPLQPERPLTHDRSEVLRCLPCRSPGHTRQVLAHRASPGFRDDPCLLVCRPAQRRPGPVRTSARRNSPFASKNIRMPRSPLPQATSATGEPLKKAAEARLRWICFLNRSRPRQLSETSCSCRQQTAPSRHRRSVWLRALSNTGAPLGAKRASLMAVTKVGWRLR